MKWVKHFLLPALVLLISFLSKVQAQDQSGFLSIDCGLPANSTYVDPVTSINYISDAAFIDTGIPKETPLNYREGYDQPLWRFRSFPEGIRNCYTIKVARGQKYLIRTRFLLVSYDEGDMELEFDLYLGLSYWNTITFLPVDSSSLHVYREIIHVVSVDRLQICLVNKGKGTPSISAIDLRPMPNHIYQYGFIDGSMLALGRLDIGNLDSGIVRFNKDDIYDRFWEPYNELDSWKTINTRLPIDKPLDYYLPPSTVMTTAATPLDPTQPLKLNFRILNTNNRDDPMLYVLLYFAEIEQLQPDQSRVFDVFNSFGGSSSLFTRTVTPKYLSTTMETFIESLNVKAPKFYNISFRRDKSSTLPPLVNGLEVYEVVKMWDSQTEQEDVEAMMKIKSVYGLTKRNWQGDPCAPKAFIWDGVNCTLDASNTSSIISLNLSSAKLTGYISSIISNLKSLQILDLSYNNLNGPLPNFLADMSFLKVINLSGNNLTGSVPTKLLQKSKRKSLSLSLDGNPYLCQMEVCNNAKEGTSMKRKNELAIEAGTAAGSLFIILFVAMAIFWRLRFKKNRRPGSFETNSRRFTYSEIVTITGKFKSIIGEGGFGKVYLGQVGDAKVAVKMLSPSSVQGYKEFRAEAELLMRVHHRNLISLIGYCDEDNNLGLVYEYMALGNLRMNLSEAENTLTWEQRLQIARDAAQGLDYLHRGCRPLMIHRDVKSSNILINEEFNGKVADFGLSRASPLAGGSHESTAVAGTLGYIDPEYFATNKLSEKSDVYSFGVVLLEIVTCRAVTGSSPVDHIIHYVNRTVSTGDVSRITDPRLVGNTDVNSIWRILELAKACVAQESTGRPKMNQVVMELEQCLASIRNAGDEINSSVGVSASKLSMEFGPEAR